MGYMQGYNPNDKFVKMSGHGNLNANLNLCNPKYIVDLSSSESNCQYLCMVSSIKVIFIELRLMVLMLRLLDRD